MKKKRRITGSSDRLGNLSRDSSDSPAPVNNSRPNPDDLDSGDISSTQNDAEVWERRARSFRRKYRLLKEEHEKFLQAISKIIEDRKKLVAAVVDAATHIQKSDQKIAGLEARVAELEDDLERSGAALKECLDRGLYARIFNLSRDDNTG